MLDKLIDFLTSILKIFQFWVVIYPYERGVLLRLGKYKTTLNEGLHWCFPLRIDRVVEVDTTIKTVRLGAQSLITSDNKQVIINTNITYKISDAMKASLNVFSPASSIDDICSGAIASFVSINTLEHIIKCCDTQDKNLILNCSKLIKDFGIKIIRIQFSDVTMSRTIRLLNSTAESASYWDGNGRKIKL